MRSVWGTPRGALFVSHLKDTSTSKILVKALRVTKGGGLWALKPTVDSIYLAERINERWDTHNLSPAALQKLVNAHGVSAVEDKLRELHGFPPEEAIRSPYAYLETMLKEGL